MTSISVIDSNLVRSVEWQGDPFQYDHALSKLGNGADNFIVPNPNVLVNLDRILTHMPRTIRCIVWKCKGEWIAKQFHKNWIPNHGYLDIEVPEHILDIDIKWEKNPDIDPLIVFEDDPYQAYSPTLVDCSYELVWYIDPRFNPTKDRIWIRRCYPAKIKSLGVKYMGYLVPSINDRLDVIFISYNEPNAEDNWKKVLARAPWAQRIHGVAGIFNAHKAAAKLSKTDMFFVVDGDADLADDWNFDFQPSIFDRNCAYVWASRNPVNDLIYGYGGVKLFPKSILMKKRKWNTLDMFTGLMKEIKVNDAISCTTNFNSDEFSTWRSAFRECVKLYTTSQMTKLTAWLESDITKPFGKYAVDGARAGYEYAKKNKDNQENLLKINDYDWLSNYFEKVIE